MPHPVGQPGNCKCVFYQLSDYRTGSSYRSYIGKSPQEDFVDYEPVLAMMDGSPSRVKSAYRRFVESGIEDIDSPMLVAKERSRLCIGSDEAVERIEERYHELFHDRAYRENASFQRQRYYLDPEVVDIMYQVKYG